MSDVESDGTDFIQRILADMWVSEWIITFDNFSSDIKVHVSHVIISGSKEK